MVIYSWLALRLGHRAVSTARRCCFREAERLDVGLWLRRLLRDKEGAAVGRAGVSSASG